VKRLAVIIVNYNVKHFLEQCLISVRNAMHGIDGEIWVVDNNSVDGSQVMLRERFPDIHVIESKVNLGFSGGNNLALRQANAQYLLLLNPDTVVEENTFTKCLDFMDAHPDAGALGVKMLDGEGNFLPESKRGLPSPWVAFYKISGLSMLFPKSKRFGKYHLGYLDKDQNHQVEVLSGAFMMMRKETLDKIGLLDEDFFMYGEDIDLSYRVTLGGYRNYYFAGTKIIHYKGESTKKGSLNYVKVFYNAMIIFAKKHFSGSNARSFILIIQLAVYLRAFMAVLNRLAKRVAFPLVETGMLYGAILGIKTYWEYIHKLQKDGNPYPDEFTFIAAPIYALVFIVILWVVGGYRKPYRFKPIQTAAVSGFVAIATVSYLFPEINFSRMIVGLSSVSMAIITMLNRNVLNYVRTGNFFFTEESKKRVVIAGNDDEVERIVKMVRSELDYPVEVAGTVRLSEATDSIRQDSLGNVDQLDEIVAIFKVDEVIFANKGMSTTEILDVMAHLEVPGLKYKIVPPDADYLVGPNVIHSSLGNNSVSSPLDHRQVRVQKRLLDLGLSVALLLSFPLLFWRYRKPLHAWMALVKVLIGQRHLVAYIQPNPKGLPKLKPGILNMLHRTSGPREGIMEHAHRLDHLYAQRYSPSLDIEILVSGFRQLGVAGPGHA
jgi:GT2 family glycosyltransferase